MIDQAASLRKKLELYHSVQQAKTIAVVSGKGGVGKSNFALNFALELAEAGKKVLIMDLDIGMGNLEILLGKTPKKSIVHLFSTACAIEDIVEKGPNSISYIAGGSGLDDIFTMDAEKFNYFLSQFENLLTSYEFIIFDMGAGITEGSAHFILAADECIVVTTPEPTSLTDAYAMIKHVLKKNFELSIMVLVNRAMSHKKGEQTMERLTKVVRQFLLKEINPLGIVPEDRKVMQAVSDQLPFVLQNQKSPAALAIRNIADHYLNNKVGQVPAYRSTFIHKMKAFIRKR